MRKGLFIFLAALALLSAALAAGCSVSLSGGYGEGRTFAADSQKYAAPSDWVNEPFTVRFVFSLPKASSDEAGVLLGNYCDGELDSVSFEISPDRRPCVRLVQGGVETLCSFGTALQRNTIVELVFVFEADGLSAYAGGVFLGKEETVLPGEQYAPLFLGGDLCMQSDRHFRGTIYAVSAYRGAAADVQDLPDDRDDSVIFSYRLGGDNDFMDCGPNGNDLSLVYPYSVRSARELEVAAASGDAEIRIARDFSLDRTVYVGGRVRVYTVGAHCLTRAGDFAGDLFVVGEDASGRSLLPGRAAVSLDLGGEEYGGDKLTIDGNSGGLSVDVTGTVLFISYGAEATVYPGVAVVNCRKVGNERALNGAYGLSYPEQIGGAVAIVANGTLNIRGGRFSGNSVNSDEEQATDSSRGGVIYNFSNVNISGGEFTGNSAARGGAIYNYRMLKINGGSFLQNAAARYGGAVYLANSQYAELLVGAESVSSEGGTVLFEGNEAGNSGGAVFSSLSSAVVIYKNAYFLQNRALSGNGGAINVAGTLTVKSGVFSGNTAASKGGAVYAYYNDESRTARVVSIAQAGFFDNYALRGGAIGMMADSADFASGAVVTVSDSEFIRNAAKDMTGSGEDLNGGAIYVSRKSTLTVSGCTFRSNTSRGEGGAVYGTGESTLRFSGCTFDSNAALTSADGSGGAIAVHSCVLSVDSTAFSYNESARHGGAMYVSYTSSSAVDSSVTVKDCVFLCNVSNYHGGAVYVTCHLDGWAEPVLRLDGCRIDSNSAAQNGGGVYVTSAKVFAGDTVFAANSADSGEYGGGALYLTGASAELEACTFTQNESNYNGGALAAYSGSSVSAAGLTVENNTAHSHGGAAYVNNSSLATGQGTFGGNTASGNGGAIYVTADAQAEADRVSFAGNAASGGGALYFAAGTAGRVYRSSFVGNRADNNGGALYVYTGGSQVLVRDSQLRGNTAENYGGAAYVSSSGVLDLYNNEYTENTALRGGVLYITTTGTVVTLNGATVLNNAVTAGGAGPIVYGNSTGATLRINKANYADASGVETGDAYWAEAIVHSLTVEEVAGDPPAIEYGGDPEPEEPVPAEPAPAFDVSVVFSLAQNRNEGDIDDTYAQFARLDNSSNFMSLQTTEFAGINGKTVSVDSFVYHENETAGNPNVGEGILIYQAMVYKQNHPEEEVSISISSFHFSVSAAVCISRESRYFGYMRNLYGANYDDYGFVRIAYLLAAAAGMGIRVTVIGQLEGYPLSSEDPGFDDYFTQMSAYACDPQYAEGSVGDYLDFNHVFWTSYGDKAATDMMHVKVCAVSAYTDSAGKNHSSGVFLTSTNLDGINPEGSNGNNALQTAVIVSDHDALCRTAQNYLGLLAAYSGQEQVYEFRELVNYRATRQIDLIEAGRADEIPADEQIVYLGSRADSVFELYFAPFGGSAAAWSDRYNPYCKYVRKLAGSDGPISFSWNVASFRSFPLSRMLMSAVAEAFLANADRQNRLYLVSMPDDIAALFDGLVVGENIGSKLINEYAFGSVHAKDVQLSYSENGRAQYVSLLTSLNIHGGSMSYQANQVLVIKENDGSAGSVYSAIARASTKGIV